ncbi:predicted protein [Streptomyces viridosporus ATCC 14672]|uniref:Predicted protein n=1 Tax=Streptomyces viridosporus (strain ATCC 14672 / DSM 40746 / JCM 4963 / KCTC 9882 / NRRL B-12104 / FH 1290) TaxID=566461 RepID=D6A7T5_STRV1|nr:predicted protein [Streptomyces viridosporus ATCC 14672]
MRADRNAAVRVLVPPLACPPGYQASSIHAHQVGYFARHLVRLARNRRVDVAWVPGVHARSVGPYAW